MEDDPSSLDRDALVAAIRHAETTRAEALALTGRLLAELHDRCGLSWPEIGDVTGVPKSTAYRRAEPYLRHD